MKKISILLGVFLISLGILLVPPSQAYVGENWTNVTITFVVPTYLEVACVNQLDFGTVPPTNVYTSAITLECNATQNTNVDLDAGTAATDLTGPGGAVIPVSSTNDYLQYSNDSGATWYNEPNTSEVNGTSTGLGLYSADVPCPCGTTNQSISVDFHLKVPPGQRAGSYTGTLYIMLRDNTTTTWPVIG